VSVTEERRLALLRLARQRLPKPGQLRQCVLRESEVVGREGPLVVCYGAGVDSTALLIELARRQIRPDLILFADVGAEKPETYNLIPTVNAYLEARGFPPVTIVRLEGQKWRDLEHQCLDTRQLPALAFGSHSCSLKWKVQAQNKYMRQWEPALIAWSRGVRIIKTIGYDASPRDQKRSCRTFLPTAGQSDHRYYSFWYPLQEWGITRGDCGEIIRSAGLPDVLKSSCWYCPAMKRSEIVALYRNHPDLFARALAIEDSFRGGPHYRGGSVNGSVGVRTTEGLGRNWSWRAFYESGFETRTERQRRLRIEMQPRLFDDVFLSVLDPETSGRR
jgi:hypothetical protein